MNGERHFKISLLASECTEGEQTIDDDRNCKVSVLSKFCCHLAATSRNGASSGFSPKEQKNKAQTQKGFSKKPQKILLKRGSNVFFEVQKWTKMSV